MVKDSIKGKNTCLEQKIEVIKNRLSQSMIEIKEMELIKGKNKVFIQGLYSKFARLQER